jgi:hypothetical protein
MLKSALDAGVEIELHAGTKLLLREDGRVVGVAAERQDGCRGCAPASASLRGRAAACTIPSCGRSQSRIPLRIDCSVPQKGTGNGIRPALEEANTGPAFWAPVSVLRNADGSETVCPRLILDRQKPGLFAVNGAGERFVNDASSYHDFVAGMHREYRPGTVPHLRLICNHRFPRAYGLGPVRRRSGAGPGRGWLSPAGRDAHRAG